MDNEDNQADVHEIITCFSATYEQELKGTIKFDDDVQQLYKLQLILHPQYSTEDDHSIEVYASIAIDIYKGYPSREAEVHFDHYGGMTSAEHNDLIRYVKDSSLHDIFNICTSIIEQLTIYADGKIANMKAKKIEKDKQDKKVLEELAEKERTFMEKQRSASEAIQKEIKERREQVRERAISLTDSSVTIEKTPPIVNQPNEGSKLEENIVPIAFKCKPGVGICEPTLPLTVDLGARKIVLLDRMSEKPKAYMQTFFGYDANNNEKLIIYKWNIHINAKMVPEEKVLKFTNTIKALDQEMKSLLKLSHENLVSFKGLKWIRSADRCISLFLLYECVWMATGFSDKNTVRLSEVMLKHLAEGSLNALEYMHQNDVVHRDLRPSSFLLHQKTQKVRLTDYGLKIKCIEAVAQYYSIHVQRTYPVLPGRSKKLDDTHRLGLVLVQLFNIGRGVLELSIKPMGTHTEKFSSFLKCCMVERWSTDELLAHKFITDDDYSLTAYGVTDKGIPWIPENLRNDSRLYKDYKLKKLLGQGGFGSVYKVQSKTEGNVYALKIIKLEEEEFTESRKMIQEVKLLSSLNHENVVRYYTSWKETLSEMLIISPLEENQSNKDRVQSSHMITIEDSSSHVSHMDTTIDSILQDEEELHGMLPAVDDDDDSCIQFEDPSQEYEEESEVFEKQKSKKTELTFAYLYIQMEFCEKNTLRRAIDHRMTLDDDSMMWRLFREVVNGLNYIHAKGLIHRDLKPGNIFIDSNDHIKIGDFGLATEIVDRNAPRQKLRQQFRVGNSAYLTGRVGTTFYIAPEIKGNVKVKYSNKVDMYSLGIIFFEMVYQFNSAMERAKVLDGLKLEKRSYPDDYESKIDKTKQQLIDKLLNTDPRHRPTTRELLDSDLLPPLPEDQQKFMSMIKEAIEKEGSASYQDMLQLIFNQKPNTGIEATFDILHHHKLKSQEWQDLNNIYCRLIEIFRKHGGIWIPTPFFTPKGAYSDPCNSAVFVTKDGDLVMSQYDLRYPFARFIAKHEIKTIKRFYIDKIQRSIKTPSVHPRESFECSFDIVDSQVHLMESVVRLLLVAQEVLLDVCGYNVEEIVVKLCHTDLVKIILLQAGIAKQYHQKVFSQLNDLQRKVCGFEENSFIDCVEKITNGVFNSDILKSYLSLSGTVSEVITVLKARHTSCKKGQVGDDAFGKLCEQLQDFVSVSREMGIKFVLNLQPLMVADIALYDGIAFQLQTVKIYKKVPHHMVLAKGGSYYHLISNHKKKTYIKSATGDKLCAVGISLALASLYDAFKNTSKKIVKKYTNTDVLVCSIAERQIKRRMEWVKLLQDLGLSVDHCFMEDSNDASSSYRSIDYVDNFLCLQPDESEKYLVKPVEIEDKQPKLSVKYLSRDEVLDYFTKIARPYSSDSRRESNCRNVKTSPSDSNLHIEFICRKPLRDREDKIRQKISEDIDTYLDSKFGLYNMPGPICVIAVDLDKNFVVSLRELDIHETLKSFNDSVIELKSSFRDPESKDYMEKVSKFCIKNLFHAKKQNKPFIIVGYSIPSEYLRRIY